MIRLTTDMFASLAISAKALTEEESSKKINDYLSGANLPVVDASQEKPEYTSDVDSISVRRRQKAASTKPIEETVEDMIDNPEIKVLKNELNTVEEMFNNLKDKGENMDFLFRIEKRIEDLKKLIDQKSYV